MIFNIITVHHFDSGMHVARKRNQAEATPPLLYANASVSVPVTLEEAKR
jgi:hypothetical protein